MNHLETYLNADGTLRIVEWARRGPQLNYRTFAEGLQQFESLLVSSNARPSPMYNTAATGQSLVSNGQLGADIIRVPAGRGFAPHTHPGDHLLFVLAGSGTICYAGDIYPTSAGQVYMVKGEVAHAVGAIEDHVILAIGAPHRDVDSPDRQALVEYNAVLSEVGTLNCLICRIVATFPILLHDKKCAHCPCINCV